MSESRIFQILLENNKNEDFLYDYPKLQAKAADITAKKFTEIIYETLNQKSIASHVKRKNVLKYIHNLCGVKQCHLNETSYECFLNILRRSLQTDETGEISELIKGIRLELETDVPRSLADKVVDFYRRKNCKLKEKCKKLESMNSITQEKLNSKFNMQVSNNFTYSETTEDTIRDLLGHSNAEDLENELRTNLIHTVEYREKQIKFAYGLLNLKTDLCLIEKIMQRLSTYEKLEQFEVNFLIYVLVYQDETFDFMNFISEKFPFVLEKLMQNFVTEILRLKEEEDVYLYFSNLENDKKLAKIKKVCADNTILSKTMKNLLYEMYIRNFCNKNVLKLIDFIN